MAASSDERDRGERLFCDIGGTTVALQSQDLDLVGFFLPTRQAFQLHQELKLRLRSPIGELHATARVVHVLSSEHAQRERKRPGCALVFVGLAEDERVWLGLTLAALGRTQAAGQPSQRAVVPPAAPAAGRPSQRAVAQPAAPAAGRPSQRAVAQPPTPLPARPSLRAIAPPAAVAAVAAAPASPRARSPEKPSLGALQQPSRAQRPQSAATPAVSDWASSASDQQRHWLEQRPLILQRLRQALDALEGKAPWEILGIERDAAPDTAKQAFLAMSKRYHPHAFARFDCEEISRLATQLFIAHKRAFTKLSSVRPPPITAPTLSSPPTRGVDSKRPRGGDS